MTNRKTGLLITVISNVQQQAEAEANAGSQSRKEETFFEKKAIETTPRRYHRVRCDGLNGSIHHGH